MSLESKCLSWFGFIGGGNWISGLGFTNMQRSGCVVGLILRLLQGLSDLG